MADPTSVLGLFNLFLWSAALQHCSAGSAWLCHMQQKHLSMSVRTQTIRPGSSYLRLIQLEMMPTCSFCRSRPNKSSEAVRNCEYNKKPRIRGFLLAPPVGLEPTTLRLTAACSTDWAKEERHECYFTSVAMVFQALFFIFPKIFSISPFRRLTYAEK